MPKKNSVNIFRDVATCNESNPFSSIWKVISRKPLDLEIGGVTRKFSKKLVDLTRNDPQLKIIMMPEHVI